MKNIRNDIFKIDSSHFKCADHFDHIVIDNFLEEEFATRLVDKFPGPTELKWWSYNNPLEKKLAFNDIKKLNPVFSEFFEEISSHEFISWLSKFTGIELHADPSLNGGGLHLIKSGGKLDVHEDFNIHREMKMLRCVNLIIYLNKDWNESWGGDLELWDKEMTVAFKKIQPIFNRAVLFRTDMNSNHGHPHPLNCPVDRCRMSLASYFYRKVDDIDSIAYKSTYYKKLPGADDGLEELRERRKLGRINDEVIG